MSQVVSRVICILVLFVSTYTNAQQVEYENSLLKLADSLLPISITEAEAIYHLVVKNEARENKSNCGFAYRTLANICASHSRKQEEIQYLFQSHLAFRAAGDQRQVAEAQRLIGHYFLYMKLFPEARKFITNAYDISLDQKDTITQIKAISNLAQLAAINKQYTETIRLYNTAIRLSELKNYQGGLRENWNRISYAHKKSGEPTKMLEAMRQALRYAGSNKDTLGILYGDMGFAFMENQMYDSADYYLDKGLSLINTGSNLIQKFLIVKFQADLRIRQKRYPEAIELLGRYDSLRGEVFTDQLKGEVGYAEARYNQLSMESLLMESQLKSRKLHIVAGISIVSVVIMTIIVIVLRRMMLLRRKQKAQLDVALSSLKKSEGFLRQLFESSPSLIFTHTLEGKILSSNRMVDSILGEAHTSKHLLDIILPVYRNQYDVFVSNLKQQGESSGWFRTTDSGGVRRIFRYHSRMAEVEDGDHYAITFAMDDSEVFKARSAMELERQRLLSVMENSPDIYAIFKEDSTIEFINHPDFFDGNDATGTQLIQYVQPNVAARFSENLKRVFTSLVPVEYEEMFKGNIYLAKLIPILADGKVKEVLGIGTDITEKRQREDREKELNLLIERNEKRYRSLVEASQVLICSHDLDGYLITVNLPGADTMGYQPEELMGRRLDEFLSDEFKPEFHTYMETIKTTGLFEGFLTVRRKDGSHRVFLCRNVLLKEDSLVLGSAQDVTEWKKAEYREMKVKKELQLAKEEAEESNRLKSIFLGSLSHEVRTPLQGILGFAEILDSPNLTESNRKQYLDIIKQRTYDMQNIIESLLDIASVETGELQSVPGEMNLYEYAELIYSKTKQDYPFLKNVEIEFENLLSPQAIAFVDPQHLNQVLINLIRNAVKFTMQGTIKLKFERRPSHFRISITDTGMGIAKDKLQHIFKPFRQAHEGISRSKGGIGLGLAICKKMVELWQGEIEVESRLGVGSTFSITIPVNTI